MSKVRLIVYLWLALFKEWFEFSTPPLRYRSWTRIEMEEDYVTNMLKLYSMELKVLGWQVNNNWSENGSDFTGMGESLLDLTRTVQTLTKCIRK